MRIAILGSRGIPNTYGGFEQCAEHLSQELVGRGHHVTVYSPHFHPWQEPEFNGVQIIHKWCPENRLGAAAHFIYDYLCLRDATCKNFDALLELGYTSTPLAYFLCNIRHEHLFTNMDGLEWKRTKWKRPVRRLVKWFEKLAANRSHYLVADNTGIQLHLREAYGKESFMIPYGAEVVNSADPSTPTVYGLQAYEYFLLIARLEPENNIEMILDGYMHSGNKIPFLVIGNHRTKYGEILKRRYHSNRIRFLGSIYDKQVLDDLRWHSRLYFHGHSVGGTNPALLESMAARALIAAHDNRFNRSVLRDSAFYFSSPDDVSNLILEYRQAEDIREEFVSRNLQRITTKYSWSHITDLYLDAFTASMNGNHSLRQVE